jgi:cytochrome c-type biogenesis protein CcsB
VDNIQGPLFALAAAGYFVGAVFYVLASALLRPRLGTGGSVFLAGSLALQSAGLVLRGIAAGALPVTNTPETLVFYGWVFALGYLVVERLDRADRGMLRTVGAFAGLLACAALALASSPLTGSLSAPQPLVPALRSHWLALHVSLTLVGEGFFAVAFVSSLLYLARERRAQRNGGDAPGRLDRLDRVSYRAIVIGFPFFTLGALFFGAVWAKHAWGRYWGWDPKETWTLIIWLWYLLLLHSRELRGWRGRRLAWLTIAGFGIVFFAFAGLPWLLRTVRMTSLHAF